MENVYVAKKQKTGWLQLAIVVAMTGLSFYFIKNAFAKPYAEFQNYNEIRISQIEGLEEEISEAQ